MPNTPSLFIPRGVSLYNRLAGQRLSLRLGATSATEPVRRSKQMSDAILSHLEELSRGTEMATAIRNSTSGDPWHAIGQELRLCAGFPHAAFRDLIASESFHPECVLNFCYTYLMCSGCTVDHYAARLFVALDLVPLVRLLLTPDNYPDLNWCRAFDSEMQHALCEPNVDAGG